MKDYRQLTDSEKLEIDNAISSEIDQNKTFEIQGTTYNEQEYIRDNIHSGYYCAECWHAYYNCLCNHDDNE